MESVDRSSEEQFPSPRDGGLHDICEEVGPGGDPVTHEEGPAAPPHLAGSSGVPTGAGSGLVGSSHGSQALRYGLPAGGVVVDCGWGRLVFGQTFPCPSQVADVLRSEADGARDICVYLPDPHLLVADLPDELFLDPSLTYRLDLDPNGWSERDREDNKVPGLRIRPLADAADAEVVNRIYSFNGMIPAPVEVLVQNASDPRFIHLVAEASTGHVVGTVTGVDHVEVFDDPEQGSSLWCLSVDPNQAPRGTGRALVSELASRLVTRGRAYVDLSVLAQNDGAIRLYERFGFRRIPALCVKRKSPINEKLFLARMPAGYDGLNPYARIIADEAMRRGIRVEVLDPQSGELRLSNGARSVVTKESLSELTSAVAMSRCDDKRATRRALERAGLRVPRGRQATDDRQDLEFLAEVGSVVVKPARGEQGAGITVGVRDEQGLRAAIALARDHCPDVLIEEWCRGDDLRVLVIDHEVVAAAVRRPASVTGDGVHTIAELIEQQSLRRQAATDGESSIPLDDVTLGVVRDSGHALDEVLPAGEVLPVRRTANLHTGGTLHDVTDELHPDLVAACVEASRVLAIPVTGLDLLVPSPRGPEHVFIEANERPGLANHEPQPTAERFLDLLFPGTSAPRKLWSPNSPSTDGQPN